MANPAFVNSGSDKSGAGVQHVSVTTTGIAVGDTIQVAYTGYASGTLSPTPTLPDATWTTVQSDTQNGGGYTIFSYVAEKVATSTDAPGATYVFSSTLPSGGGADCGWLAFSGQDATTAVDASAVAVVPNGTTATSPSATATVSNDTIVCYYIDNGNTGAIPSLPSGLTSALAFTDSTNGVGLRIAYVGLTSSGASPTYTSTFGETVDGSAVFGTMFTVLVKGASTSGSVGTAAQTDGADIQSASGVVSFVGSSATTDGADLQSASGAVLLRGMATQADGADIQAAAGAVNFTASASQHDGADTQLAAGLVAFVARAAQTDGADLQSASGVANPTGATAAQVDGADTQFAQGQIYFLASAAQHDGADVQIAAGASFSGLVGNAVQLDGADIQTSMMYVGLYGKPMPSLVGMYWQQAIDTLIRAGIIQNEGTVPWNENPPVQVGVFSPWPVALNWQPGAPDNFVTSQSPNPGTPIAISDNWNAAAPYTPPITLTVNAPRMGVSGRYTAGGYA